MSRSAYFIRRLLLILPTFLGITMVCYGLTLILPGGPVEQAMMRMRGLGVETGPGAGADTRAVTEREREALRAKFELNKPFPVQYWNWLVRDRLGLRRTSIQYPNKTSWEMIRERFRVSVIFGLTGFFLTYLVCIPLGVVKALRHGTTVDLVSTAVVFSAYAVPPFAFAMALRLLLAGMIDGWPRIFPASGFTSNNFSELGFWLQVRDVAWHMALPLLCYMIGSFAFLTQLMKNSLLDQVQSDYVRTVLAKGGSIRRAVWKHALRNALIPVATGFGAILTIVFAGALIIETIFEIPGMGKLSYEALLGRDYPVFLGVVSLTSILGLLGNVLSDFCYILIDPRISFGRQ